jgi:chromosome partitioning protein
MLDKLSGSFLARSERARNRSFLDAAMAASALVATADGEVSFAKRHRVDEVLENATAFKAFDFHTALVLFEAFAEDINSRPEEGRAQALKAVSAIAGDREEARLLVRIACAVARADRRYSRPAITRIQEITETLGQTVPELEPGGAYAATGDSARPHCIAIGNEKGGTGKSTTAVHLAVGLIKQGLRVGCIDLDGHQGTLFRYLVNRDAYAKNSDQNIPMPLYRRIEPVLSRDREAAEEKESARLNEALAALAGCDYLILDTPGGHGHLARLGHGHADTLITPLNDSFLDIDVLAQIDREKRQVLGPSAYARMVMQQSERRVAGGRGPIDWIVMRNRLAQLDARNTRDMAKLLDQLAGRMGFRLQPGLSERVIFRELFYNGLTLLDLPEGSDEARFNPSRWNARKELHQLVNALGFQLPHAQRSFRHS